VNLIRAISPARSADHAPLLRNAYALMANTVVTGLLGLAFWLLAARHYAVADVGRATAAFAAMNMIANITALSLIGAMARFIPRTGRGTGRLVRLGYGTAMLSAIAASFVFLAFAGRPGTSYSELSSIGADAIFAACAAVWSLFTLQDGVLTGLRSAKWVTLENALFGLAKIIMLVPLAAVIPRTGLYVSWMVPAALAVPLVNLLIFGRLLPAHAARSDDSFRPGAREVGRYLAGDVPGALLLLATLNVVPVLVASSVPPDRNAYFAMAWTIGITLDLLAVNMGLSLTVEGASDPARLARRTRIALRRIILILVPAAAIVAAAAPLALGLFGPGYAEYGTTILMLMAAAMLPRSLTEIYLGAVRAQNRTGVVALVQGIRAVVILGLAFWLTRSMGIVGAGLAVLIGQTAVAAAVAPALLRITSADRRVPAGNRAAAAAIVAGEPANGRALPAREPAGGPAGGTRGTRGAVR